MAAAACGQDVREVAAVLVALAGLRRGEAYASAGAGSLVDGALAAAAGPGAGGPVRVCVAGGADHLALAWARLAPGGRVVAVSADRLAARRDAHGVGAVLLDVVALPRGVAWLGRRRA